MAYAKIDYGFSVAKLWGDFPLDQTERFFMRHANECYGIRKSIMCFELLEYDGAQGLPAPWSKIEGAATVLMHNFPINDTIVWDGEGQKIKTEWD